MAWKIRNITGAQRLDPDLRLESTRIIEFMVDNPQAPEKPYGPFRVEVPQAYSEQQMRDLLDQEAAKFMNLARGG